jgi:hypothetical protein
VGGEEIRLEQAVVLQQEVVVATDERAQDGRDHLAVVKRPERFADVVQQGDDHVLLVLAVAQGPSRRLEAVIASCDVISDVPAEAVEQPEQPVGQLLQGPLVDPLENLEILVRPLIHPREMHFLR